ncbi:hypothetical protein LEP1GSC016_2012 [Leptospira borgpetersenii serovar Hardjo-bovis str. Sponselee]|nr:hypothetical protein LBK6_05950 [Leptospira borgpetersenii serovar Hardjo]EMJ83024.1 hypothetical protein LEP1GSC016_2012 [Leptospira borgpetersenii serovar Hardjo-bovis str. Sponselee]EMO61043.1 hypothetical protein LEP1GSC133_2559 [Leptospira borgpetersenii serovar Pomona str. 200901868]AMX61133.1 hypothetical protein LBK9_05875 [Leptospira borgpetersenii serovar Hardjo]AMX64377.1 hypothetical protein LBK30_05910 [Leptospira borgpetersenii serovar Hardjo]
MFLKRGVSDLENSYTIEEFKHYGCGPALDFHQYSSKYRLHVKKNHDKCKIFYMIFILPGLKPIGM